LSTFNFTSFQLLPQFMLQCLVNITLVQVAPYIASDGTTVPRNEIFNIGFCHSFEMFSSWNNLSDTATIELPKNIYVKDANNKNVIWGESSTPGKIKGYVSAGGFSNPEVSKTPLIMRGDEITITAGYSYISNVNNDGSLSYSNTTANIFHGFVSSLESKSTLKIHCEDFMWLLKQTAMKTKTYSLPGNDISNLLNDIVTASNKANNDYLITSDTGGFALCIDGFATGNETAAESLNRLKKILPSLAFYFRDDVLRGGGVVYFPQDQSIGTDTNGKPLYNTFNFQKNIISDQLHYSLKNDIKVAAICYSVSSSPDKNKTANKMGGTRLFTSRLQATVGVPGNANSANYEFYTFYFKDITTPSMLTAQGQTYLNRYQYDGYRGRFKTFGIPFVKHGNIIYLTDDLMPERNGHYIVKSVHYTYSIDGGLRQDIELHFRTDNISQNVLEQGM
jgi:hypothetical protein